jgi:hypothetical protein
MNKPEQKDMEDWPGAWRPPQYEVDGNDKIIGYVNDRTSNNWGRWGELDELGTINFVTPLLPVRQVRPPHRSRICDYRSGLTVRTAGIWPGSALPPAWRWRRRQVMNPGSPVSGPGTAHMAG